MSYIKKDINVEIGARIKEKRKSRRYTREALAELVDISPQFLGRVWKKGMSLECPAITLLWERMPDGKSL